MAPSLAFAHRNRPGPICVAVAAPSLPQLFRIAEAELAEGTFLELRFDALQRQDGAPAATGEFLARHPEVTILATCRRTAGGGQFSGPVEQQPPGAQRRRPGGS